MTRTRRNANAVLLVRPVGITSTLHQISFVKPSFGRPIYRYELGSTGIISAEEGMGPNLHKAPLVRSAPSSLFDSQYLPDEVSHLSGEQEPRDSNNGERDQGVNDSTVKGRICPQHGKGCFAATDSYLPTSGRRLLRGKGASPFARGTTWWQSILGYDGPQSQPFCHLLLISRTERELLIFHHCSHYGLCGSLDFAHPAVVAWCTDTFHRDLWCVVYVPLLIHILLGAFRPPSVNAPDDLVRFRRRWLGPRNDVSCPTRDNVLGGRWRLATKDAPSWRRRYGPIHESKSAEIDNPKGPQNRLSNR